MITSNYILKRHSKKPILIDATYSEAYKNQGVVIFCHGYKGFKDWGAWNIMSKDFANAGIAFVKFNFSHNGGTVSNPIDFPDLEAFGNNNYTKELNDLGDVIDWVMKNFKNNKHINTSKLNLIGHSRGGGIVLLKSSVDRRVKKVITLAGVSDFELRFGSMEEIKAWRQHGVKFVLNGRTKQQMPHYFQFYEDFIDNKERLNIRNAAESIEIPHLILHGDKDSSVKINEAFNLHKWNPKSQLEIIKNADHVFNTSHPWKKTKVPFVFNEAIEKILAFLK